MSAWRLVADVGGSNVRFALADEAGRLERVQSHQIGDYGGFTEALKSFLAACGRSDIVACVIAAAGPVDGDTVKLTNNPWSIHGPAVSAAMDGLPVVLVNDLEAVAAALPHLGAHDMAILGGPVAVRPEHRTMLALNVGTGFGAATALRRGGQWWTCPSEVGHMTLGPLTVDGLDLLPPGASNESVMSGRGVVALYQRLSGSADPAVEAADVFARADHDAAARRTVELFTTVIGRLAGNLVLATAAWGGVYFCGSVAVAWSTLADSARFRAEFSRKGPMQSHMQQVPTAVIERDNVALFGLAMMALL